MTLINREDVLALIPRYVSPAMASDLADAIAALPAQAGEPEGAMELLREAAFLATLTTNDRLENELAAAQRDAERYRWIREHGAWETESFLSSLDPEQYDAAIDNRINQQGD